jgi:hypothetical protein
MRIVRVLTWLGAAAVLATPFFSPGSPLSFAQVALEEPMALTITGSIDGLRHDVPARLALTLSSRAADPVVVHSVTVRVTDAPPGCSPDALSVGDWSGELGVPAYGRATAAVRVLLHDPTGGCTGATWQLGYTST